jgi:hypothetical protein
VCPRTKRESQSTHDVFSGDCQFFFAVGVSNGGCKFAGFPQGFKLCEGSVVLFTETRIECFGAAFWKVSLVVECGRPFFRSHAQGDSQAIEDRTCVRYGLTTLHRRHNGTRCSVSENNNLWQPDL